MFRTNFYEFKKSYKTSKSPNRPKAHQTRMRLKKLILTTSLGSLAKIKHIPVFKHIPAFWTHIPAYGISWKTHCRCGTSWETHCRCGTSWKTHSSFSLYFKRFVKIFSFLILTILNTKTYRICSQEN